MSKTGPSRKQGRYKKKTEQVLETADDFQDAGVEFEDAAGKWRAGDAVKSMRFFTRALEVYNQGLSQFPQSLDLAYNKARVQLEIATHPILVKQLQVPVLSALEDALVAHRYALNLDQDNPDTLFNTSQVLTSIAEELSNESTSTSQDALQSLEEALELQNRCLSIQEFKFEEAEQMRIEMMQSQDNPENQDDNSMMKTMNTENQINASAEDQWFAVVEPITKDTLIDTILVQLGTLTTMCSILASNTNYSSSSSSPPPISGLSWIEEYSSKLLNTKLPALLTDTSTEPRRPEIALTKATFISTLLEVAFRLSRIDSDTYKRERDQAFASADLNLLSSYETLLSNAQSLINYNAALTDHQEDIEKTGRNRWAALSSAISNLSKASSSINQAQAQLQGKTHKLRGDCSLLQARLAEPPTSYGLAIQNRMQLLKNAEIFYRNAAKLSSTNTATADGDDNEEDMAAVAGLRSAVARILQANSMGTGTGMDLAILVKEVLQMKGGMYRYQEDWIREQLEEMVDDGLTSAAVHSQ